MIKILFFAQTRELIGTSSLELDIDSISVEQLLEHLSLNGDKWSFALKEKTVLCAINQKLVNHSQIIHSGDEVAFFPPVTGG